jgi:hypothetical protein
VNTDLVRLYEALELWNAGLADEATQVVASLSSSSLPPSNKHAGTNRNDDNADNDDTDNDRRNATAHANNNDDGDNAAAANEAATSETTRAVDTVVNEMQEFVKLSNNRLTSSAPSDLARACQNYLHLLAQASLLFIQGEVLCTMSSRRRKHISVNARTCLLYMPVVDERAARQHSASAQRHRSHRRHRIPAVSSRQNHVVFGCSRCMCFVSINIIEKINPFAIDCDDRCRGICERRCCRRWRAA